MLEDITLPNLFQFRNHETYYFPTMSKIIKMHSEMFNDNIETTNHILLTQFIFKNDKIETIPYLHMNLLQ